ncbi:MAG TPA: methylated-DNA--[protein]-cysteine S-methyltransferase [Clostridia bacterium]|nr:methylated-DNA--[protein]-cysteine S-methyltransferase [Clostridia bacterium]
MNTSRARTSPPQSDERRWTAVLNRAREFDGAFVFGVTTTGIYCRPSCPARRPNRANTRFFSSPAEAERAGLRACLRCRPKDAERTVAVVESVCRYLEAHVDEKVTLAALGRFAELSPFHLQRLFSQQVGVSPREYQEAYRFTKFKSGLKGGSVTNAFIDAGFSSSSRVYETARMRLGMPPRRYGAGAPGEPLRFKTFNSAVGEVLVIASSAGVCSVQFVDGEMPEAAARREYPNAQFVRDDKALAHWADMLNRLIDGEKPSKSLPLDIRGTAFQQRVWRQLQKIPRGETRSYAEIAAAIDQPNGARAVANACASNPIAVVIPCHRVVPKDGKAGGYRWGRDRKKRLLALEQGGVATEEE